MRRSIKPAKFERKVLIFGDVTSEEEEQSADTHFLGIIRKVLREALDGLLSASEVIRLGVLMHFLTYRKNPNVSDTPKIAVIILKFEL